MANPTTLLEAISEENPERASLIAPGGPAITYRSLREQVERLAGFLQRAGISRGDRVASVLPNGIEAVVAFLAAATAGTAAPLNPSYKLEEFQYYLSDTGAKVLIVPAGGAESARHAAGPGTLVIESRIDAEGSVQFTSSAHVRALGNLDPSGAEDVALVLHTSGTTSRPKRVPLRHANLLASARTSRIRMLLRPRMCPCV